MTLNPAACDPAPISAQSRLADAWAELAPRLAEDVGRRAEQQLDMLTRTFERRRVTEAERTNAAFDQLRVTLSAAIAGPGAVQLSFEDLEVAERRQLERDRLAWHDRLERLEDDRRRQLHALEGRFAGIRPLVFPFAVVCATPAARHIP